MASAWPLLPSRRRAPERVRRQPLAESGPVAAARGAVSSGLELQRAVLFLPKAAGLRRARPQLLFPAWSVQVPSAVKLHTHFSSWAPVCWNKRLSAEYGFDRQFVK